ncbi:hypothetical protein PAXRUDRAFT_180436 [Paxillus rubicundulus Ve08.2h10]|uniref:DDE Tnp4 domain-containing protein n=1 Tax=Paxillus rubicundulus Ve08.2h10 TaxID=930991 RepID=A0A0D0CAG9_9AGAM|nr:hypothetical protein PAXRUDRAFT_180436 [Paxillus rubicundulus Ve08.2h10]
MKASQLPLLKHFADHCPHLFCQRVRVNPDIFDVILDQISDHLIFSNQSHNHQLPVAIQLAMFLNCVGHYVNAISPEYVAQWAGISTGSVINCTNCVMVAILDQHDTFMQFPALDSEDVAISRAYIQENSCPEWHNGILAADGSAFHLHAKPTLHGKTFFDRKSNYSLNCQVSILICLFFVIFARLPQLVILPHNLLIADYGIGFPRSVHDAYAFQYTWTSREHVELLGDWHWVWADSAYPSEPWCVVPFKKPRGGGS